MDQRKNIMTGLTGLLVCLVVARLWPFPGRAGSHSGSSNSCRRHQYSYPNIHSRTDPDDHPGTL